MSNVFRGVRPALARRHRRTHTHTTTTTTTHTHRRPVHVSISA